MKVDVFITCIKAGPLRRVHNKVLRSRLPAHFSPLIPLSHPSLRFNPDTAVIFNKRILIKIKTYLYTMGSKYETITTRKHALMMFLNMQSRFLLFAFKLFSEFKEFHFSFWHMCAAYVPVGFFYSNISLKHSLSQLDRILIHYQAGSLLPHSK